MIFVYVTLILAALAYLGWRRQAGRATFNLPTGLAETLAPQFEALQQAIETETAERIVASIQRDFARVLRERGAEPTEYRLVLPPPGLVSAIWVEDSNGLRITLAELDERLDERFLTAVR